MPEGQFCAAGAQRIRESVFSIIQDCVAGASVLDLFAGIGANSAEAISQGADEVVLVDETSERIAAIKKNLRDMNYTLLQLGVEHALARLKNQNKQFDIVFLDPPEDTELGFLSLRLINKYKLLKPNGIIIFQSTAKNSLPKLPKSYIIAKDRSYGTARILILEQNNE